MTNTFNPGKITIKRKAKGLTQQELATRAGVAVSTICLLEFGKKEPREFLNRKNRKSGLIQHLFTLLICPWLAYQKNRYMTQRQPVDRIS
ncbi:MAG: helix-turn-helix domain-containing protein [Deltaproteobacteria bacterium]|nr:helix-turn-helix domain-containing protein [Deltaproteobacteria bacterium]